MPLRIVSKEYLEASIALWRGERWVAAARIMENVTGSKLVLLTRKSTLLIGSQSLIPLCIVQSHLEFFGRRLRHSVLLTALVIGVLVSDTE